MSAVSPPRSGSALRRLRIRRRARATTVGPADHATTVGPADHATTVGPADHATTVGPADHATTLGPAILAVAPLLDAVAIGTLLVSLAALATVALSADAATGAATLLGVFALARFGGGAVQRLLIATVGPLRTLLPAAVVSLVGWSLTAGGAAITALGIMIIGVVYAGGALPHLRAAIPIRRPAGRQSAEARTSAARADLGLVGGTVLGATALLAVGPSTILLTGGVLALLSAVAVTAAARNRQDRAAFAPRRAAPRPVRRRRALAGDLAVDLSASSAAGLAAALALAADLPFRTTTAAAAPAVALASLLIAGSIGTALRRRRLRGRPTARPTSPRTLALAGYLCALLLVAPGWLVLPLLLVVTLVAGASRRSMTTGPAALPGIGAGLLVGGQMLAAGSDGTPLRLTALLAVGTLLFAAMCATADPANS